MRMGKVKRPYFADDGLLVHRNATVYVCDAEDREAGGLDVHLCVGDDDSLDHIYFDSNATLCNRQTLLEAWQDAADWLHETASTLQEMCNHIRANDFFGEDDDDDQN